MADIETDNDNLKARALADDIAAFINSKKARLRAYFPAFIVPLSYLVFAAGSIIAGAYHSAHHKSASQYYAVAILLTIFAVVLSILNYITDFKTSANNTVWIIAARRNERKQLSERTRRDIIIATIAAVIGAVVIGAAGLWAGLLVK